MREEKVENMAHETPPASAKRHKPTPAAAGSPYNTPPGSVGPTMSDDMYMLMDEDEKTSVSLSGGRSGARSDKELLKVVTDGDSYDDGYRSANFGHIHTKAMSSSLTLYVHVVLVMVLRSSCKHVSACMYGRALCSKYCICKSACIKPL